MKRVLWLLLGLLGIFALTSSTSERNPTLSGVAFDRRIEVRDGGVSPVYVQPQRRKRTGLEMGAIRFRSTPWPSAPSINQAFSQTPGEPVPAWLSELNLWRRMAGLGVVAANADLSYGSEQHARYLVVQGPTDATGFRAYDRSIGPGAHLENSHNPSYTKAGAAAAIGGALAANIIQGADVAWEGRSASGDIDNLIVAPFHRLSLLAPWAQIGGYGSFGEYPRRAAALALRGSLYGWHHEHPTEFPPANSSISIAALSGSEWPNPIASCPGYERPVGLPVTLEFGRSVVLQSYSFRDQTSRDSLEACGFDAATYHNANPLQQRRGRELLRAYGALVLIPRKPLIHGHQYIVTTQTSSGKFDWEFRLNAPAQLQSSQAQPTRIERVAVTR